MTNNQRLSFVCLLLFFNISFASAMTLDQLNQEITSFEQSGLSKYAPASMKKVTQYQGASMLAQEQQNTSFSNTENDQKSSALQSAIQQTLKVLKEAKNNAHVFTTTFEKLLKLGAEANKAFVYHHKPQNIAEPEVTKFFNDANLALEQTVTASEAGQLNLARQAEQEATDAFEKCIDASMAGLVEQTNRAISQASSVSAKRFAPHLWELTEAEFGLLERYYESLNNADANAETISRPEKIGLAYEMAVYTQQMAIQVKSWSRDYGSHEKHTLETRQNRIDLAKALGLNLDYEKVGIDIEAKTLVSKVQMLKQTLDNERKAHQTQTTKMAQGFDNKLAEKLHAQRLRDQQAFQSKVSNIKSAFNSKLEQETFENKRQKQIYALFKKKEVDIIPNLDGSLMIRAKRVQFEPNSSKVDGKYFEFFARIKEALNIYPSRQVKIEGHTDSIGDEKANRRLSLKRAEAVQEFLIAAGIDEARLRSLGYGEVKPIASNMYAKGRTMNRRIDITIEAP
ncbi:MAG: OmpA family protein [Ghiorsea sp.]